MKPHWRNVLPDDWLRAAGAASELREAVGKASKRRPMAWGGATFAAAAVPLLVIDPHVPESLVAALVTVVGILAGFLMTLMLFTGRSDSLSRLLLHEARTLREHILFLLGTQAHTFLL